jgi:hypothetical protein
MPGSTLRKSRGASDAPPAMAPPEAVPQADSDDLITLRDEFAEFLTLDAPFRR